MSGTRPVVQGKDGRGSSVLQHPDKDEIIEMLLKGESTRSVEKWLRVHNPNKPRSWVSYATLQIFRKNFLNVKGETLKEIRKENQHRRKLEKRDKQKAVIRATEQYQVAKREAAQQVIDVTQDILFIHDKIMSRIKLLEAEEVHHKNDQVIVSYLQQLRSLLGDYRSYQKEANEGDKSEYSINLERIRQYFDIMKQAVFETLLEVDESLVHIVLGKLKTKLAALAEKGTTLALSSQASVGDDIDVNFELTGLESLES